MTVQNFGIIGAGVAGRIIALELLQRGQSVTLFDQYGPGTYKGSSFGGIGLLSPYAQEEHTTSMVTSLGEASLEIWDEIIDSLPTPVFYENTGSLIVSPKFNNDAVEVALKKMIEVMPNKQHYQLIDQSDLKKIEPDLGNRFQRCIFLKKGAQIANRQFLDTLGNYLKTFDMDWQNNMFVDTVENNKVLYKPVKQGKEFWRRNYDWVIDCRGLNAQKYLTELQSIRGEWLMVYNPAIKIKKPICLQTAKQPIYILPRPNGRYAIGCHFENKPTNQPFSVKASLDLLLGACEVDPRFVDSHILEMHVNNMAKYSDNNPRIIIDDRHIHVNGLYQNGFLVMPKLAKVLADYLQGKSVEDQYKPLLKL